jgi:hypothetical protein
VRPSTRALLAVPGVLLLVLAGAACGSSDGPDADAKAAQKLSRPVFPADQEFTAQQLAAALPTARQVRGAGTVQLRCRPGRKTASCAPAARATYAEVVLSADHVETKPTRNHRQPGYWRPEVYDVVGKRFVDEAAADAAWDQQVADLEEVDGSVDTKAVRTTTGQSWGTRGTGRVSKGKVLGLDGVQVLATVKDVDLAGNTSKTVQVGVVVCRWGQELASVKVLFWDDHHEPGEALARASTVMEDYLERLGKSA